LAKDKFHDNVREALQKEGWTITAEQMQIDIGVTYVEIDLIAEMLLAAERAGEKIAVEVKSFLGRSLLSEWHAALGQFLDYRDALEETEPDRMLFLALPAEAYKDKLFQGRFLQKRLEKEKVKLIVYDPVENVIVLWKN
jgi:XisH protein